MLYVEASSCDGMQVVRAVFLNLPFREAAHRTAAPTIVQIANAGTEASGPNAPPVSQLGMALLAVLVAIEGPKSPPDTVAPNR